MESLSEMMLRLGKGQKNPYKHLFVGPENCIKWTSKQRIQALFDLMYRRIAELEAEEHMRDASALPEAKV